VRRYALQLTLAGLVVVVAAVGFFVGYLRALDDAPPARPATTDIARPQGGATFFGRVESTEGSVVVAAPGGLRYTFDPAAVTVVASAPSGLGDFRPGDLVLFAVERNLHGDQAIRYVIRVPRELQTDAAP
jgi:hypothetical protein